MERTSTRLVPQKAIMSAKTPTEPDRRRPRTLFTRFGGINVNLYQVYLFNKDGTVNVTMANNTYTLDKEESYLFLQLVGDNRRDA